MSDTDASERVNASPAIPRYDRVLLKLSGEVFGGGSVGVDPDVDRAALAALAEGKAVLCEKPIALDMKDVEAARAELDAVKSPVMFGFNRRFDPQPFHLDPVAARDSVFGGLAASGWHTAAVSMRTRSA